MGTDPDYWRQLDVFNPAKFNDPVHVIGAGATGSHIIYNNAKMGVPRQTVWDFDSVEVHNLPNQMYGKEEVGMLKVDAAKKIVTRDCGTTIVPMSVSVDGTQKLSGIVFLCTDTMASRKEIWEKSLKYNLNVKLVIETRLGAELGYIYAVRPCNPTDVREYEATFYSDDEAEQSPCTYRAITTVVSVVAGAASHKLVKFAAGEDIASVVKIGEGGEHSSFDLLCIRPILMTTCNWQV